MSIKRDSFIQNLARGDILVPFLERYDRWDRPFTFTYEPKKVDDGWHPSGDCLPSVRDLYHKAKGSDPENHSPQLQRTFLVGHFWHQIIQDALVDMELAEPSAIERKGSRVWGDKLELQHFDNGHPSIPYGAPYYYATGSGDVAPLVLPDWTGIMDIKTMNHRSFEQLIKHGTLPEWAADKYEAQINVYMDLFDQEAAMILAVNKDTSQFAEVRYERNQDLIDAIYAKWEYVSLLLTSEDVTEDDLDEEFVLTFQGTV